MRDEELKQLIHDISIKFGTEEKAKKKICLVLTELLNRYKELNQKYPIRRSVGRPKKGEGR